MTFDQHIVNGIYNLGDALWSVFGALMLLATAVFVAGLMISKALDRRNKD